MKKSNTVTVGTIDSVASLWVIPVQSNSVDYNIFVQEARKCQLFIPEILVKDVVVHKGGKATRSSCEYDAVQ